MNHDFDGSSCASSGSLKSLQGLLQFEVMGNEGFGIHCSRGNQCQGFGVTMIKRGENDNQKEDLFNYINLTLSAAVILIILSKSVM